jgi:diguanylate cyclase (GGDEF)-like protein
MMQSQATSMRQCHHEALAEITQQHDVDALCETLMSALQDVLDETPFRLYLKAHRKPLAELSLARGTASDEDAALLQKLESRLQPLQEENGNEVTTVLPILLNGRLYGAVIIEGRLAARQSTVDTLLTIFSNQLALLKASNCDALTGLYNRQAFDAQIARLLNGLGAGRRRASDDVGETFFAMLDIDNFKKINDEFGHLFGDEVLLHFARQMQLSFRDKDLLFRYGGEEFVVVLQTPDDKTTRCVLERFRQHIQNYHFPRTGRLTVSIGYTRMQKDFLPATVIEQADRALYYAKSQGRNQTCSYELLRTEGQLNSDPSN